MPTFSKYTYKVKVTESVRLYIMVIKGSIDTIPSISVLKQRSKVLFIDNLNKRQIVANLYICHSIVTLKSNCSNESGYLIIFYPDKVMKTH